MSLIFPHFPYFRKYIVSKYLKTYRFNSVYDISDKDGRWLAEVMQTPTPSPKRKYGPLM